MGTERGRLPVPGAELHYEVRGTGPVLLIIQAGAGDARHSDVVGRYLAEHYTVVAYDRRGLSRSTILDDEPRPVLATHADDVHRLLAAVSTGPALVLGCSIGALIGLELAGRHGEQVHTLVAHEPPALRLLPAAEQSEVDVAYDDVERTYREHGVEPAMAKLFALIGGRVGGPQARPSARQAANLTHFLEHDFPAVRGHRVDVDAVRATPARVVPAVGERDPGRVEHRCAVELAARLGTGVTGFPGAHAGFLTDPKACAGRLRHVLEVNGAG